MRDENFKFPQNFLGIAIFVRKLSARTVGGRPPRELIPKSEKGVQEQFPPAGLRCFSRICRKRGRKFCTAATLLSLSLFPRFQLSFSQIHYVSHFLAGEKSRGENGEKPPPLFCPVTEWRREGEKQLLASRLRLRAKNFFSPRRKIALFSIACTSRQLSLDPSSASARSSAPDPQRQLPA